MRSLRLMTFTLFAIPLVCAGSETQSKHYRYVHYSHWKLSREQSKAKGDIEKYVAAHFVRHGVVDPQEIDVAKSFAVNLIWRESNFRNVVNHNDKTAAGKKQTVFGYAQFREETYRSMLKKYMAEDGKSVPKLIRDRCVNEWKSGSIALRCQIEVLSFALRQKANGTDRYVRAWGTRRKAEGDTEREQLAKQKRRTSVRAIAMSR